jgi:hypothetical protein
MRSYLKRLCKKQEALQEARSSARSKKLCKKQEALQEAIQEAL